MKAQITLGSEGLVHIVGSYLGTHKILPEGEAEFAIWEEEFEDGTKDFCVQVTVETEDESWSLDAVKERLYEQLRREGALSYPEQVEQTEVVAEAAY